MLLDSNIVIYAANGTSPEAAYRSQALKHVA